MKLKFDDCCMGNIVPNVFENVILPTGDLKIEFQIEIFPNDLLIKLILSLFKYANTRKLTQVEKCPIAVTFCLKIRSTA